eukprot:c16102_g1_i2 orf=17-166(-)
MKVALIQNTSNLFSAIHLMLDEGEHCQSVQLLEIFIAYVPCTKHGLSNA